MLAHLILRKQMLLKSVVIAVIENHQGQILIAQRQNHQTCPGKWEFPGGKVEPNETLNSALAREMIEEVNLAIESPTFLFSLPYHYPPDSNIELHIFHVTCFSGEACGAEGQLTRWVKVNELSQYQFPPANQKIIAWLEQRKSKQNS